MPQKTVYSARNSSEAAIVKTLLQDAGIRSIMTNDSLQGALGELPLGSSTSPQIVVDEPDFDRARQVVAEYEADLAHPDASKISDDIGQFDWPLCPDCDEMREMTCPSCQYTGSDFQLQLDDLADDVGVAGEPSESAGADPQIALPVVCGRCEAKSQVAFQSLCRYCQHDFTRSSASDSNGESIEHVNLSRTAVLVGALLLVAVILAMWAMYFA